MSSWCYTLSWLVFCHVYTQHIRWLLAAEHMPASTFCLMRSRAVLLAAEMYTQPMHITYHCVLERSFLHGSDRDFIVSLKKGIVRRGRRLYRYRIQSRDGADRKGKGIKRSDVTGIQQQLETGMSSLEGMAAAASNRTAEYDWMALDEDYDPADNLNRFRGLVLDLSYRPINVVSWKRSLCLEILEKAEVLVYYDQIVCSPSRAFFIPAVLRMSQFLYAPKQRHVKLSLSKTNVFIRDKFKCQYCNCQQDLTVDHVLPVSKGGTTTWDNLVTACRICNGKKGSRSIEDAQMKLNKLPKEPKAVDNRELPPNYRVFKTLVFDSNVPSEWADYLPARPKKAEHKRHIS